MKKILLITIFALFFFSCIQELKKDNTELKQKTYTIENTKIKLKCRFKFTKSTITDMKTSLMWQRLTPGENHWHGAKNYAQNLTLSGYSDWRLPTKQELQTIVETKYKPTIDPVFDCRSSFYWSDSSYSANDSNAWHVNFNFGNLSYDDKSNSWYVRCVRSVP